MIPNVSTLEASSAAATSFRYATLLHRVAPALAALALAFAARAQPAVDDMPGPGIGPPATITDMGMLWESQSSGETQRLPRPIHLDLTILVYDPGWSLLWAIDNASGLGQYVPLGGPDPLPIQMGQRVLLHGEVVPQNGLEAGRLAATVLEENAFPEALKDHQRFDDVNSLDVRYLEIEAFVESQAPSDATHAEFKLLAYDKSFTCYLVLEDGESAPIVEKGFARFRGTFVITRGPGGQPEGMALWVANPTDIAPPSSTLPRAFDQQATPIEKLSSQPADKPTRVIGVVYGTEPGKSLALRDDTGQAIFQTQQSRQLRKGDFVEVVGYPVQQGLAWTLRDAVFRPLGRAAPERMSGSEKFEANLLLAEQILRLPSAEAAKGLPAQLAGVVTYTDPGDRFFYLTDSSGGIRVLLDAPLPYPIEFSAAINVVGRTARGEFAPVLVADSTNLAGAMPLPPARKVSLEQASSGLEESQWIDMTGHLRSIERDSLWTKLLLATSMGEFEALIANEASPEITAGSTVRIRGVCVSQLDANGRPVGVRLLTAEPSLIETIEAAPADPFSRPAVPIASLQEYQALRSWTRLTQVKGVVVHHRPGRFLIVSDGESSLRALSRQNLLLSPGDTIDVVGLPGRDGSSFVLREAIYRKTGRGPEPQPVPAPAGMAVDPRLDGRLVRLEGRVISYAENPVDARLLLQTDSTATEVTCETPQGGAAKHWLPGSLLSVVGVYSIDRDEFGRPLRANLQLRGPSDVKVLRGPAWWTAGRALSVAGICLGSLLVGLAWATSLRRRVARQTELIRAQFEKEALLEARHREIASNASDFIFTLDLDGRFTSFNPAGERLTGYSAEQAARMTIFDLLDSRSARRVRAALRARLDKQIPAFTNEIARKDGTRLWVETGAGFVSHDGKTVSAYGVMRDVTARMQVEEELRRARDAAEANTKAKAAFLATMSHELRSPMNGIIGMTSLMLDTKLDPEQRDFMETVRSSAQGLLTLLNDILEFSRAEASKLAIESEVFDFADTVDQCLAIVSPIASDRRLELAANIDPTLPRFLVGDRERLRQVLLNLLNNAVKFTDVGSVSLDIAVEEQSDRCADLRIEISDTGIGIDASMREKLFSPFVQADGSYARRHGGTGLGLAICRQLVELMGGSIGVRSALGMGSTFWVRLRLPKSGETRALPPAAAPRDAVQLSFQSDLSDTAGEEPENAEPLEILVVDDMPVNQRVARLQLKRLGHHADVAANGVEALELASRKRYDVVFMDCQMPEMDGFEATRRLRADPRQEGLYIIALTANALAGDRERCLAAGMDDYLGKPSNAPNLKAALDRFSMQSSS